jgi:[acyl-carrier-protein] S-malonyltransferase
MGDFSAKLVAGWSERAGVDLRHLGTTADADEIKDTAKAQPLLVLGGLTGAGALFAGNASSISLFAGHSVGEITAAAMAQVINGDDAISLVAARGREMAKAADGSNTGMSAVLGGERDVVVTHLLSLGLTPANENGAGQIVAAGTLDALAKLAENPPAGARVRPLAVSGAFHTSVMQPAVSVLADIAAGLTVNAPSHTLLSNKDGAAVADGREVLDRIVGQIAGPVRWDLCMQSMADLGVTGIIEMPPAGTLAGLIKRAQPKIETFALKSPDDLDAARTFIANHGGK